MRAAVATPAHLATVVWGARHAELLCDRALPALLGPGNLSALTDAFRPVRYHVIADDAAAERFETSAPLARLRDSLGIDVLVQRRAALGRGNNYAVQHAARAEMARSAAEAGAFFMTVFPDVIFAVGSLAEMLRRRETEGAAAFYFICPRVTAESFLPAFDGGAPARAPDALARLALDHLHPQTLANRIDAPDAPVYSDWTLFPIYRRGRIAGGYVHTALESDLLAADLGAGGVSLADNQTLDAPERDAARVAYMTDPSRFLAVSPTPRVDYADWYATRGPMDALSIARRVAGRPDGLRGDLTRRRFGFWADPPTSVEDRAARARIDRWSADLSARVAYLRLFEAARAEGCPLAARYLALVLHRAPRLPTGRRRGPRTLLLPTDAAAARLLPDLDLLGVDGMEALPSVARAMLRDGPAQTVAGALPAGLTARALPLSVPGLTSVLRVESAS